MFKKVYIKFGEILNKNKEFDRMEIGMKEGFLEPYTYLYVNLIDEGIYISFDKVKVVISVKEKKEKEVR